MGGLHNLRLSRLSRTRLARSFVIIAVIAGCLAVTNSTVQLQVPAGTHVRFHLAAPLSSNESKSGQSFGFVLTDAIEVDGRMIAAVGATGAGTLMLAGRAGNRGHEGDLTLRIDSVPTADGGKILFDNQTFEINGVNAKAASMAAGMIPFVGFFAQFIRGQEEHLGVNRIIETVLLRPADVVGGTGVVPACAATTAPVSPESLPAPSESPSPGVSATTTPPPTCAPTASPTVLMTPYNYTYPPASVAPSMAPSETPSAVPSSTPLAASTPRR
jgi:hypothetical protein